jgi:Phage integrase family
VGPAQGAFAPRAALGRGTDAPASGAQCASQPAERGRGAPAAAHWQQAQRSAGGEWSEFDLETGHWVESGIRIKQGEDSGIPLRAEAFDLVKRIKREQRAKPSEYLFPSGAKADAPLRDIKKFWASVCKAADLKDFHLHGLRHLFARRTLNAGATLDKVRELLGQQSSAMVRRYAKFDSETLREAANLATLSAPALARSANVVALQRRRASHRSAEPGARS